MASAARQVIIIIFFNSQSNVDRLTHQMVWPNPISLLPLPLGTKSHGAAVEMYPYEMRHPFKDNK